MARYTIEQKAHAVAEAWLTGSERRAAQTCGIGNHSTVGGWVRAAEAATTGHEKRLAARAAQIRDQRQTTLEELFQRTLDLQLRDLETADFRDRTGLLKIVSEQMLLQKGRPTSIQESRATDQLDLEIADLLGQMASNGTPD